MKKQNGEYKKSVPHKITQTIGYQAGTVISKIVLKRLTGIITLYAFDTGTSLPGNFSQYELYLLVLESSVLIHINSKKHILKSGGGIIIPAYTLNDFIARERTKIITTMIYSGPIG